MTAPDYEQERRKAQVLVDALPYIQRWRGATVVVKYGGSTREGEDAQAQLRMILQNIILMQSVGMRPVLVHGGGKDITTWLERLGIHSRFVGGLRVTDQPTVEVVEMVLCGKINKEIVALIQELGGRAVGLSGKDGGLLQVVKTASRGKDLGFVGDIQRVNSQILEVLDRETFIPVVAPIGLGVDGKTYNVNADFAAAHLAGALKAEKLVFLTDVPGFCRNPKDPSTVLSTLRALEVKKQLRGRKIQGGMVPKLEASLTALAKGVRKVHILDGRIPHALLLEIFTSKGVGTQILP